MFKYIIILIKKNKNINIFRILEIRIIQLKRNINDHIMI